MPGASKAADAVTDFEEECFALLFAVVANIDSDHDLATDHVEYRFSCRSLEFGARHRFVAAPADVQAAQRVGSWQAPGMRNKNASYACFHEHFLRWPIFKDLFWNPYRIIDQVRGLAWTEDRMDN